MAVLVCPGSCAGAIAFKRAAGLELDDERIVVGETSTLPYAVRDHRAGRRQRLPQAHDRRVPRRRCRARGRTGCYDLVKDVWPAVEKADSVFQTTLQNGNPVIHPAVTLLNAGLLERTGGDFLFYEEGVTESVGRLIEAVDNERLAIAAALGRHDPLRAGPRRPAGLHDRGELLDRVQHRRPGSSASRRSPSSTTAT